MDTFTYSQSNNHNNRSSKLDGFYQKINGETTSHQAGTISNFTENGGSNQPRMVRPLYIIIACLCGLTLLLAILNYGLKRYHSLKKRRMRNDGEMERGRGMNIYRENDGPDYQKHYKGLFIFGMRNQQE